MMPEDPKHWCATCAIPHVDNCRECYGFGLYVTSDESIPSIPVSASDAMGHTLRYPTAKCPMCGGHVKLIATHTLAEAVALKANTEPRL